MHVSRPDVTAIVKQPFYVSVRLVGNDYIASSSISNSYEIGETPGRAIVNYLEQLVDELTWLEKHKAELSPSISSDLELLRNYMQIV